MNEIDKMQKENTRRWNKLTYEQKEDRIASSIISLVYDETINLESRRYIHNLICRLDDYEALIMQQNEALKHMIAERDKTQG